MNPSFVPSPSSDSVSIISPRPFSRDSSNGITRVTSPPFSNKVTPRNTNEEEEEPKTELQLQAAELQLTSLTYENLEEDEEEAKETSLTLSSNITGGYYEEVNFGSGNRVATDEGVNDLNDGYEDVEVRDAAGARKFSYNNR